VLDVVEDHETAGPCSVDDLLIDLKRYVGRVRSVLEHEIQRRGGRNDPRKNLGEAALDTRDPPGLREEPVDGLEGEARRVASSSIVWRWPWWRCEARAAEQQMRAVVGRRGHPGNRPR